MKSTCTVTLSDVRERELHLRGVAVREQAVGRDVLVDLGEEAGGLQPRPAPDTPDAASTMIPVGSTSPAGEQRRQSERDAVVG